MQIKLALLKNFIAGGSGKISSVVLRLVQIPVLLSYMGVEEYGRWLVLTSLPGWLVLTNLGFGSVAANEMTLRVAAGDVRKGREVFSSALVLIALIGLAGMALLLAIAPFVPWERLLDASADRHSELTKAVIWLSLSIFIYFFGDTFEGRFRAGRKAHVFMYLVYLRPWMEFVTLLALFQFTKRFDILALSTLLSTLIYILLARQLSKPISPELYFSRSLSRKSEFKALFKKGIAFQAFPLGNALIFQGNLLVVQTFLGPAAVALFGTARTLVRSVNQVLELVNQVIWPELSLLIGAGNFRDAARLHRFSVGMSLIAGLLSLTFIGTVGQEIYAWWTAQNLVLPQDLLLLFLLPIPFNALWYTSSVVHMASNEHEGLAKRFMVATMVSVAGCVALTYFWQMKGAAVSTAIVDVLLIRYVIIHSIKLTEDTLMEFIAGIPGEITNFIKTVSRYVTQSA